MLHDLYLLSCYFEPTQAVLYEDDLKRRYGDGAVKDALDQGLLEFFRTPCGSQQKGRFFCRLSDRALGQIKNAQIPA